MLGTRKSGTHAQRWVMLQDRRAKWRWNEWTLSPCILHIDINSIHLDHRKTSRRQGCRLKSCNLQIINIWNHEDWVQRYLWNREGQYWGRVWARFGTCEVWNLVKIKRLWRAKIPGRHNFPSNKMEYNAIREWNCEEWLYMGGIDVEKIWRLRR